MQRKIKNRNLIRFGRVEVLNTFWNKLIGKIEMAGNKKDKKTSEIIKKIMMIPLAVRQEVLHHYSIQVAKLHTVAFF